MKLKDIKDCYESVSKLEVAAYESMVTLRELLENETDEIRHYFRYQMKFFNAECRFNTMEDGVVYFKGDKYGYDGEDFLFVYASLAEETRKKFWKREIERIKISFGKLKQVFAEAREEKLNAERAEYERLKKKFESV
jgi:hypothetical protein